jgi:hypothetical protein
MHKALKGGKPNELYRNKWALLQANASSEWIAHQKFLYHLQYNQSKPFSIISKTMRWKWESNEMWGSLEIRGGEHYRWTLSHCNASSELVPNPQFHYSSPSLAAVFTHFILLLLPNEADAVADADDDDNDVSSNRGLVRYLLLFILNAWPSDEGRNANREWWIEGWELRFTSASILDPHSLSSLWYFLFEPWPFISLRRN